MAYKFALIVQGRMQEFLGGGGATLEFLGF